MKKKDILKEMQKLADCWTGKDSQDVLSRLKFLYEETIQDNEEETLTADSLVCFQNFLKSVGSELKKPGLTVTPYGEIAVTWRGNKENPTLGMECHGDGSIIYATLSKLIIGSYGTELWKDLYEVLAKHIETLKK